MAITYPLTLPLNSKLARFNVRQVDAAAIGESPYSFAQQVQQFTGARWALDLAYGTLTRAEAAQVIAFLVALRGVVGTFTAYDPLWTSPLGAGGGTPLTAGSTAIRSTTIATDGWPASTTVLKAGDQFQVGTGASTRLHMNLNDATTNGAGQVTLDVWPPTRSVLADNTPLVISSPRGLWRLPANERGYDELPGGLFRIAFTAVEALP